MYNLLRPLLFQMDAEKAHRLTARAAGTGQRMMPELLTSTYRFEHDSLRHKCLGRTYENPVGLAAGFDKNAKLIPLWQQLGFGFAEVGSVTAKSCSGNPSPRLFRLSEDRALINRMGLNNDGAEVIAERLKDAERLPTFALGINIAKTHDPAIMGASAIKDYVESYRLLARHADYVTLNISCPNTREGTTFEDPGVLDELLAEIQTESERFTTPPPLLIKLSPPLNEHVAFDSAIEGVIVTGMDHEVDGFIATNTASDRRGCTTSAKKLAEIGDGGLSGQPLRKRATALVRYVHQATGGAVPIIGVGGIDSAESAYEKICAGASLIQFYTGLIYKGPHLPKKIKQGLVRLIEQDGFSNISEAVGSRTRSTYSMDKP